MSVNMYEIRAGLVTNLETLTDNCQKSAYRSGNQTPPALVVAGFGSEMARVAMGSWQFEMLIQGLAGKVLNMNAERRLDSWMLPGGASDVWAAIEYDKTLGGKVSDLYVASNDGTQIIQLDNGTEVLGTTWHVVIEL